MSKTRPSRGAALLWLALLATGPRLFSTDNLPQLMMGGMMLAQECLPKGGRITVAEGGEGVTIITAHGQDPLVRDQVDEALARTINIDNLDPRLVHPYAISVLANHYRYDLRITAKEKDHVSFTLRYMGG